MRHEIRELRLSMETSPIATTSISRYSRQMKIAEMCLTRMLDEHAWEIADVRYPERGKHWARMIRTLENENDEMFCRQLRFMRWWWD